MSKQIFDLTLCGGGVVGLSIAYQCAQQGMKVLVADAGELGHGASWAGAGILPAGATLPALDPLEQLRALSHRLHRQWAEQLLDETGIDNEYRRCGGLYLATSIAEQASLAANCGWWSDHGIAYDAWSNREVASRIPALSSVVDAHGDRKSWFVPEDCRVRNPRHIQALVAGCQQHGVLFREHTRIERFEIVGDRIVAAISNGDRLLSDRFCVTSGAWASQLLKSLDIETGIMPVRGQMILYKLDKPLFQMVINDGHRYLVPRDDGHLLAGSCEEEVGFDNSTTDTMLALLRNWSQQLCPALRQAKIERTWAGLRPGSFDTYPYLGTLHPFKNAYIAAGHFRHGLHWSTATAILMYQWMTGERTEIDLQPFCVLRGSPSRFNPSK